MVVDDSVATVGTINFDYRSLYLHFECGVWMFNCAAIYEIKEDFLKTQGKCQMITSKELDKIGSVKRLGQSVLRLLAPLL